MKPNRKKTRLQLLPIERYVGVDEKDPIKFYRLPVIGRMYQRRIELCLEQLAGGQAVLEVGFGSGVSFLNLSQLYQELHGLDLTADIRQVGEMFASFGIQTELRNGSVLEMPYPDQSFDAVLLISILEHLQPQEQLHAFREVWRVLKPGRPGGLRRARGAAIDGVHVPPTGHRYPPAPLLHGGRRPQGSARGLRPREYHLHARSAWAIWASV